MLLVEVAYLGCLWNMSDLYKQDYGNYQMYTHVTTHIYYKGIDAASEVHAYHPHILPNVIDFHRQRHLLLAKPILLELNNTLSSVISSRLYH